MRTLTLPALAAASLLVATSDRARGDEVGVPSGAPDVLVLTTRIQAGTAPPVALTRFAADGTRTAVLDDLPSGSYHLDAHEATGRWLMTFGQLSSGDPLMIDGKEVSTAKGQNTLVFGEGMSIVTTIKGDKTCTRENKICFEATRGFSVDGQYVFVESMRSTWSTWGRWRFGKKPKRAEVVDRKLGSGLAVSPDAKVAAYPAKDGIHVTTWPAQKKTARKLKASKKAVVNPTLLQSALWPIGDRIYYFRREPVEQKEGWYEAYDAGTQQTVTLHKAAMQYPLGWNNPILSTGPRKTVIFASDVAFERADLFEVAEDGDKPVKLAGDVHHLLDISDDGRHALLSRRKDPSQPFTADNAHDLVIFDLVAREDVQVIDVRGGGTQIDEARFVAPLPGT